MRDLKNNIAIVHLLDPQDTADTDTVSLILDTKGFGSAVLAVNVGAITGLDASNYLTPVLQDSDTTTGTDFAPVNAAYIQGGFTRIDAAAEDQTTQSVGYTGSKRYLRVNLDFTGTAITAALESVVGVLGRPVVAPAVAPAAITAA